LPSYDLIANLLVLSQKLFKLEVSLFSRGIYSLRLVFIIETVLVDRLEFSRIVASKNFPKKAWDFRPDQRIWGFPLMLKR